MTLSPFRCLSEISSLRKLCFIGKITDQLIVWSAPPQDGACPVQHSSTAPFYTRFSTAVGVSRLAALAS